MTGPLPGDPIYLHISTQDDGLIGKIEPAPRRVSDAIIGQLVVDWGVFAAATDVPPVDQTIAQFSEWLNTTYGGAYLVRQVG
jgi:hypothetical protein